MLSTATTSNQHPANFWFTNNTLPSFFSSTTTGKHPFDPHRCSSSSESSPTFTNAGQFHYLQANPFLSRDDWSSMPLTTSPTSTGWNKGNEKEDIDQYRCSNNCTYFLQTYYICIDDTNEHLISLHLLFRQVRTRCVRPYADRLLSSVTNKNDIDVITQLILLTSSLLSSTRRVRVR